MPRGRAKVTKVEFKSAGFAAILKSQAAAAWTAEHGRRIADAAGEGFDVRTSIGANRARTVVITDTPEAMRAEAEDKVLTSAIGR